ncbi:hypothetical protein TSACC_21476 [Terrimicrobium sacchariphilum]|uniref:Uncharacterized protein n=2 Tax=Terrimicrobium sacchariphilum TaxID=690879 RepID=A0A146G6B3_TERSA|nr:hypothetical protein TSACC_21476 [Terrimicrobium sacchariphilum]
MEARNRAPSFSKRLVMTMAYLACVGNCGMVLADSESGRQIAAMPVFDMRAISSIPADDAEMKLQYFLSINGFSPIGRPDFLGERPFSEATMITSWYRGSFRGSAPFYLRITKTDRTRFTDYHGEVIWPPDTKASDRSGIAVAELAAEIRKLDETTLEGYGESIIPLHVSLPDSRAVLLAPPGWRLEPYWNLNGIAPPEKTKSSLTRKIHLQPVKGTPQSLQAAIDAELDRITEQSGPRGSYNDRRAYKGSVPVKTASGLEGLHATFYGEMPEGRRYFVEKYYFHDANHRVFKVCAHIYGSEAEFARFERAILDGLYLQSTSPAELSPESDGR